MGKKGDQPKAAAKADGAVANAAETPKVTAAHLTDVQEAVKAIEMHPVMKDISSPKPYRTLNPKPGLAWCVSRWTVKGPLQLRSVVRVIGA